MISARSHFGANKVRLKRIHDAADCLRVAEYRELTLFFDRIEEQFPQLLFTVYLGELNGNISISELGFWLINQSIIDGAGFSRPNDQAILLVVDVEQQQAGLSLGYFTELLLDEEDCLRALMASRASFIDGEFGEGVMHCFQKIEKSLERKARKMKRMSREERRQAMLRKRAVNTLEIQDHYRVDLFEPHEQEPTEEEPLIFQ